MTRIVMFHAVFFLTGLPFELYFKTPLNVLSGKISVSRVMFEGDGSAIFETSINIVVLESTTQPSTQTNKNAVKMIFEILKTFSQNSSCVSSMSSVDLLNLSHVCFGLL